MATIYWYEGFDYIDTDVYATKYSSSAPSIENSTVIPGYKSGYALDISGDDTFNVSNGIDDRANPDIVIGVRLKFPTATTKTIFTNSGAAHTFKLQTTSTRCLRILRDDVEIATSNWQFPLNTWAFIEILIGTHPTTGYIQVYSDNSQVISITNIDTIVHDNEDLDCGTLSFSNVSIDDLYVADTRIGAAKVYTTFPVSPGDNGGDLWTGNDGNATDNFSLVDEATLDESDYLESPAAGIHETFKHTTIDTNGTVKSVRLNQFVFAADGEPLLHPVMYIGESGYLDASNIQVTNTGATYYNSLQLELNPITAEVWDLIAVNALEAGVDIAEDAS